MIADNTNFKLPKFLIKSSKLVESKCWKPFYKINFLFLTYESYIKNISILKNVKETGMQINELYVRVSSKKELEDITNPEYFSRGLSNLNI